MTAPFIFEGSKVLLRFMISFLKFKKHDILACKNPEMFTQMLKSASLDKSFADDSYIVSDAFSIPHLGNAEVARRIKSVQSSGVIAKLPTRQDDKPFYIPKFTGNRSTVFSDAQIVNLWEWLPSLSLQRLHLKIIFSTAVDGHNLRRLYETCDQTTTSILAIKDTAGNVFGGFCTEPWDLDGRVKGTPESFLFSFTQNSATPQIYLSTGMNNLFQLTTIHSLQMGGGGDGPGLFLDASLQEGGSNVCETYNNDPLIGESECFHVSLLEVLGFVEP
eukprot:c20358_g1_i2.p1 GENE.c20358_g1_i2~~c20358_g1_i2.p1  ORF type:complete len:275 (+),score=118.71 c20358_g1_i2:126-950(+)